MGGSGAKGWGVGSNLSGSTGPPFGLLICSVVQLDSQCQRHATTGSCKVILAVVVAVNCMIMARSCWCQGFSVSREKVVNMDVKNW